MKHLLKRFLIALSAIAAVCLMQTAPVAAQITPSAAIDTSCGQDNAVDFFTLKPWNACFIVVRVEKLTDLWFIVFPTLENAVKLAGYISVGAVIWGGIKYIKSQGNANELTGARSTITNGVIGLSLAVLSVAIVQLVARAFTP